jgi:hypothetical protein
MGRPINKRYFGVTGGDGATVFTLTGPNIPIRFQSGGVVYEGFIVKQVGSRRFLCSTDDGTTAVAKCLLTAGTSSDPVNNGEAVLLGLLNGSQPISIRRLTNKIAIDFSSNRYKWTLTDDSTETLLILTAM